MFRKFKYSIIPPGLFIISIFFLIYPSSPLFAQSKADRDFQKTFARVYTFIVAELDSVFSIDSTIVLIDSLSITKDSQTAAIPSYTFDVQMHQLVLSQKVEPGSIINVFGKTAPFPLSSVFVNRPLILLRRDSVTNAIQAGVSDGNPNLNQQTSLVPNLLKNGSLTRAFSFGNNRGLELQSGLKMELNGFIADNYRIQGVLTDQNTPLQPEGNTRTLHEIDRVFIDISGPRFSTRFGDITVSDNSPGLRNFNRKLKGVSGQTNFADNTVSFSVASSEGDFNSLRIAGAEGKQGPYILTGINGEVNIVILGGTERVWLDGEVLNRGEDADYVIDYAAGQITFTRNRLITGDSRITVDYQYINNSYSKNFYSARIGNNTPANGFRYSFSLTSEGDNKDKPLETSFDLDDIIALENAGDNRNLAFRDGVRFVGEGKGNYSQVQASEIFYVFNDSGDYAINFTFVGEGNGTYNQIELNRYEYAGTGKGAYLPVERLALPSKQSVATFASGYANGSGNFSVNSEFVYSDFDKNQFSDLNNGDNGGGAVNIDIALKTNELNIGKLKFGKGSLTTRYRQTDENFTQFGRTTEVEFDRKWNLAQESVSGESIIEFAADYIPFSDFTISPAFGVLGLGSDLKTTRQSLRLKMENDNPLRFNYFAEDIASELGLGKQDWLRQKGSASYQYKGITPSVLFESEDREDTRNVENGLYFNDWAGKLQYDYKSLFSVFGVLQRRTYEEYQQDGRRPSSEALNKIVNFELRNGNRLFTRIQVANRERDFESGAKSIETNLADIKVQSRELNNGLNTRFELQFSNEQIPNRDEVYIRVEEGRGDFSLDELTGEYYPDPNGDFELRRVTTNDLHGEKRTRLGFTLDLNPGRFLRQNKGSFFEGIRSRSIFRFENSTGDDANSNVQSGEPVFKLVSIVQDMFLFQNKQKFNLRLRQNYRDSRNNQIVNRNDTRKIFDYSARIRSRLNTSNDIESNIGFSKARKEVTSRTSFVSQDILTVKSDVSYKTRPNRIWNYALTFTNAFQRDDSQQETIEVNYFSIMPRVTRAFLGSGRLNGDMRWFRVNSKNDRLLPFEYAEGRQPGNSFNWSISFDYRSTSNFSTLVKYTGERNTRTGKTLHNLRAEIQVLF